MVCYRYCQQSTSLASLAIYKMHMLWYDDRISLYMIRHDMVWYEMTWNGATWCQIQLIIMIMICYILHTNDKIQQWWIWIHDMAHCHMNLAWFRSWEVLPSSLDEELGGGKLRETTDSPHSHFLLVKRNHVWGFLSVWIWYDMWYVCEWDYECSCSMILHVYKFDWISSQTEWMKGNVWDL